jgi:hypothetical protein
MSEGADVPPNIVLKVGFLNDKHPDQGKLRQYEQAFDLLVIGDGSMGPVLHLLQQIERGEAQAAVARTRM